MGNSVVYKYGYRNDGAWGFRVSVSEGFKIVGFSGFGLQGLRHEASRVGICLGNIRCSWFGISRPAGCWFCIERQGS